MALPLKLLLRLATRPNNLPYEVNQGVVTLGDEDLTVLLWGLVVRRSYELGVHGKDLSDKSIALLHVLVFKPLLHSIRSLASLLVVNRLRTGRPQIWIVLLLKILKNEAAS